MASHILSSQARALLKAHVEQPGESYNPAANELKDLTDEELDGLYRELLKEQLLSRSENTVSVGGNNRHTFAATAKGITRIEQTWTE